MMRRIFHILSEGTKHARLVAIIIFIRYLVDKDDTRFYSLRQAKQSYFELSQPGPSFYLVRFNFLISYDGLLVVTHSCRRVVLVRSVTILGEELRIPANMAVYVHFTVDDDVLFLLLYSCTYPSCNLKEEGAMIDTREKGRGAKESVSSWGLPQDSSVRLTNRPLPQTLGCLKQVFQIYLQKRSR